MRPVGHGQSTPQTLTLARRQTGSHSLPFGLDSKYAGTALPDVLTTTPSTKIVASTSTKLGVSRNKRLEPSWQVISDCRPQPAFPVGPQQNVRSLSDPSRTEPVISQSVAAKDWPESGSRNAIRKPSIQGSSVQSLPKQPATMKEANNAQCALALRSLPPTTSPAVAMPLPPTTCKSRLRYLLMVLQHPVDKERKCG